MQYINSFSLSVFLSMSLIGCGDEHHLYQEDDQVAPLTDTSIEGSDKYFDARVCVDNSPFRTGYHSITHSSVQNAVWLRDKIPYPSTLSTTYCYLKEQVNDGTGLYSFVPINTEDMENNDLEVSALLNKTLYRLPDNSDSVCGSLSDEEGVYDAILVVSEVPVALDDNCVESFMAPPISMEQVECTESGSWGGENSDWALPIGFEGCSDGWRLYSAPRKLQGHDYDNGLIRISMEDVENYSFKLSANN